MSPLAALTDSQIRLAQILLLAPVLSVVFSLLVIRLWVWLIVRWAVADLRRKNVLPKFSWEEAAASSPPVASPSQSPSPQRWPVGV